MEGAVPLDDEDRFALPPLITRFARADLALGFFFLLLSLPPFNTNFEDEDNDAVVEDEDEVEDVEEDAEADVDADVDIDDGDVSNCLRVEAFM